MAPTPIKMLSIDDRMLTTDLDRAGYRHMGVSVKQVSSFKEAQELINAGGIEIMVINLDYEKIDAIAICSHFRKQPQTQNLPIVITSVQTSAAARKAAINAGASLFVEQPIPRQFFIEKLKKLLDQQTRGDDRVGVQEIVTIKTADNRSFEFPIGDLSISGMLVSADFSVNDGDQVTLEFLLPGQNKPLIAEGVVVRKIRVEEGNAAAKVRGVGIRFEKFMGDSQRRLEKYVAKSSDREGRMVYYL